MACAGCNVMAALFSAVRKAGAALSAELALTFFVPMCLTGLAVVARMQVGLYPSFKSLTHWIRYCYQQSAHRTFITYQSLSSST